MLTAIRDGVTINTKYYNEPFMREGQCVLVVSHGATRLTKKEALKLDKILVAFGEHVREAKG